jgi:hypothetical protein
MRKKFASRISMFATPLVIASTFLASSVAVSAHPDDDGVCSNRTLQGDYGFAVEGLILPAPGVSVPVRGLHITHFDGRGNLTQFDSILANGGPISDWTPVTGTYHVDANCTGTMLLHPSNGGFVNLRFVVVKNGKEIHAIVWPPFDGPARTVTSVGTKIE